MLITRVQQLSLLDKYRISADMTALMEEEIQRARFQRKSDREREKKERLKARGSDYSSAQSGRSSCAEETDKDILKNSGRRSETDAERGTMVDFERRREHNVAGTTTARTSTITANSSSGSINDLEKQVAQRLVTSTATTATATATAAVPVDVPVPPSSSAPPAKINPFKKAPTPISTKHGMTPLSRASPSPSPRESPMGSHDTAGTGHELYCRRSCDPYCNALSHTHDQFNRCLPCCAMPYHIMCSFGFVSSSCGLAFLCCMHLP